VKVLAGRWTLLCRLRKVEPIYADVNILTKCFLFAPYKKAVCEADLFLNNSEITAIQVIRCNSGNRPATQAAFRPPLTRSAQPLANNTVASIAPSKKATLSKKCGFPAWPGGETARGGETAFATVSASPPRTFHCLPSRTYFKKQRKTIFSSQFLSHFYKWNPPERIPLPVTADKYWNSVRSQYQDSARNHIQPQHGLPALLQTS